jgi:hypothetical protein
VHIPLVEDGEPLWAPHFIVADGLRLDRRELVISGAVEADP